MNQSRLDSFMEAATSTAIGFLVSLVVWHFVAAAYGIPMPLVTNLEITAIFTAASVLRSFLIRRLFNGRSVWAAIKGLFRRTPPPPPEGRLLKGY